MVFEISGFVTGVAGIGAGWWLLWHHDLVKVLSNFGDGRGRHARTQNALIWPSR